MTNFDYFSKLFLTTFQNFDTKYPLHFHYYSQNYISKSGTCLVWKKSEVWGIRITLLNNGMEMVSFTFILI